MEEILGRDDGTLFVFSEIIGGKGNITFVKWHRCLHFFLMWQILGKYVMMFCINVVIWCFARSFRAPYRSMAQPEDGLVAARHLHHFGPGAMSWWMSSGQPMGMAEAETGHSRADGFLQGTNFSDDWPCRVLVRCEHAFMLQIRQRTFSTPLPNWTLTNSLFYIDRIPIAFKNG